MFKKWLIIASLYAIGANAYADNPFDGSTSTLALNPLPVSGTLTGIAPAGTWLKLRTQNNTGSPTFTSRPGQEVLL